MMPIFDFECQKCGKVVNHLLTWSKTMHKKIGKCDCGAKDFKRLLTVGYSYTRDLSSEEREAEKLIRK